MNPSLKQLQYLVSLSQTEHFGFAAEKCHVSQSALSMGIRDLENLLGVQLFERTKRQVQPTLVCKNLLPVAREILEKTDYLVELAQESVDPLASDLHLGVIPTIGPFLLPDIMPQLARIHPRLRLFLREEKSERLVEQLVQGRLDLLILAFPYPVNEQAITTMDLCDDYFSLVMPTGHRLSEQETIDPAHIPDTELLVLEDGHCLRDHSLGACNIKLLQSEQNFLGTSLHTLIQMVAHGLGLTLIPDLALRSEIVRSPELVCRPLKSGTEGRRIVLCWRTSSAVAPAYQQLGQTIQELINSIKSQTCITEQQAHKANRQ